MRLVDQPAQRAVIGLVEHLDPPQRLVDVEPLAIDFLAVADHARDGAETAGDPHRAGVGKARQPPGEHPRVELIGLAVHVDIGAREVDPDDRKAAIADAGDHLVHEAILGAAQRRHIYTRRLDEFGRIDRARMRGIEDDRRAPGLRLNDLERGRQLASKFGHSLGAVACVRLAPARTDSCRKSGDLWARIVGNRDHSAK